MTMSSALAIMGLSPGELLIIVGVIVLLFGASKIPQLMRSMGQGLTEFKKGIKEGEKDAEAEAKKEKEQEQAKSPEGEKK
jgi:sec-independent protein translocase protein TatA